MELGYVSKKQALWFSFLKGIAAGSGAFIGGTVVIGIVIWILSYFSGVPIIDKLQSLLTSASFLI